MGVGDQAIAAYLIARKVVLIHQHHLTPLLGQGLGASAASGSGAQYQDVAGLGE